MLGQSDRLDPFYQFDWSHCWTHRGRAMTVLSGARNSQGRLHGKVSLLFSSGEEVEGTFVQGRREGLGRVRSRRRGMSELRGCWSQDQLGGLVEVGYTEGTWAQGWVSQAVWHGAFRSDWSRLGHLHVEECSEELLRHQSYAIKNQLWHPKPPTRGFGTQIPPSGGILLAPRWFFMA